MRRNLVIVRAGDTSLHEGWLTGVAPERNWDLIVNYFGDDPERYRRDDVTRIDSKGPKWPALHDLILKHADLCAAYDYVWLPDDDLRADLPTVNTLFDICHEYKLELAQPALTPDSYISHYITLANRCFKLRYTNFVEIMAPCFSRAFLNRCAPKFGDSMSGWGFEFAWAAPVQGEEKIAIIDAATICHTRPVGGANYSHLRQKGLSPFDEIARLVEKEGVVTTECLVLGGIDVGDEKFSFLKGDHTAMILRMVFGILPELNEQPQLVVPILSPNLELLRPLSATTNGHE